MRTKRYNRIQKTRSSASEGERIAANLAAWSARAERETPELHERVYLVLWFAYAENITKRPDLIASRREPDVPDSEVQRTMRLLGVPESVIATRGVSPYTGAQTKQVTT